MAANVTLRLLKKSCLVFIGMMILFSNGSAVASSETYFSGSQLLLAQAIVNGDSNAVNSLAKETDLNKPGKQDMTLLFYALQTASNEKPQQLKILSELVKQGADPLQIVRDMGSVAGVAAHSPRPSYMQALLDGGMSPDALLRSTPIIFNAADDDTLATLALLVERGADVNKRDSLGATALMNALDGLQLDAVSWLLDHGADPRMIETNSGWSFSQQLSSKVKRIGGESNVDKKLQEIINKSVAQGMKWPPTSH